ncbi:MAG: twin-arginine translocase TatA/TatE family subunit [Pseudomonadales bacterium]|jgi:sec-independent protein translocase protein TatA|nr:twin-arginine translocase TatA/TatE family subunit [Gammaproteobacteria bacterium]|tara:strand:+ start:328 stop:528 length:201 start_codon:yes stop_codon:yes gene_type:complete
MSLGITELIIILVIVLVLFGTTKLKSIGNDLGSAIKGFRTAVSDEKAADAEGSESAELAATQDTKD